MSKNHQRNIDLTGLTPVLDKMPMGIALWRLETPGDSRSFRILYGNGAISELLGVTVRPFIGKLLAEADPGGFASGRAELYLEALSTQRIVQLEPVGYGDDKIKRDRYFTWAVPLTSDLLMVVVQDPAPYQKELAAREEHFRALIEHSADAVQVLDAQGVISYVSSSVTRMLGYEPEEMIGQVGAVFVHPDDMAGAGEAFGELLAKPGHFIRVEQRVRRKDGSWAHIEVAANNRLGDPLVHGVVVNYHDISERKRAEDLLRASEERFRAIIEQFPYAVVTYAPDGTTINANRAWEDIWNDKRENTVGYNIRKDPQMLTSGLSRYVEQAFRGDLAVAEPYLYDPGRIGQKGRKRWIQMVLFPLKNEKGTVLEVILILQDVTDRKEADEELQEYTARKKTEEVLKQSEERMRAILNNAYNAFVGMDDQGLITEWNTTAETMFGWTRQEALGRNLAETIIPTQSREAHQRGLKHLLATGEGPVLDRRMELSAIRRDGSVFPIELSIRAMMFNDRYSFNAFIADITDRKKAEQEIRQMEDRFRRLLESAPDAMVIADAEGTIQLVNAQAERIFGYNKEEMLGQRVEMLIPSHLVVDHQGHRAHFAKDPKVHMMGHGMELQGRRKDGSEFPVEVVLSPLETEGGLLVSAAVRDITDRKHAENRIRELNRTLEQRVEDRSNELLRSEKRYHDAMDILIEGVQIIGFDWRHLYVNDSLVAQSTFTKEELVGTTMMERYPGIEQSEVFSALQHCMKERVSRVMETEFAFPNGTKRTFHLSIQPVAEGLFMLSTDITDRKKAEMEVTAQREQLEQQNKELEQFAYIASHDLQEPLRMVTSYVQLLQRRYSDKLDSDANEFIAFAVDGAFRMKQLIDDLLTFSRLGRAVTMEDVDMNTVFDQVQANLATAIAECGAILTSGTLPRLRASQTEMLQVLQNLIGNAVKFRRDDVTPEIHLMGRTEPDHWHFEVRDNGIGMDEQYGQKVFVPFKRLHDKTKYSGSGIGLAVAQKIVQRYGGRIWFTSVLGQGTTFHFIIKHPTR
jgi:PAS domain S-box-containing protein